MALHRDLGVADIHIPHSWTYANAAAREAATGFSSADYGKLAAQLDDASLWRLVNHSPPTWAEIDTALSSVFGTSQAKGASESEQSTTATDPTYAEKLLVSDSFIAGTYALHYSTEIRQQTTGFCRARVTIDGGVIASVDQDNDYYVSFSGFRADLSLDGPHSFKIEWARTLSAGTAWMRRGRLWVYRIA